MIARLLCWLGRHDWGRWRVTVSELQVRSCQRPYCGHKEWR